MRERQQIMNRYLNIEMSNTKTYFQKLDIKHQMKIIQVLNGFQSESLMLMKAKDVRMRKSTSHQTRCL